MCWISTLSSAPAGVWLPSWANILKQWNFALLILWFPQLLCFGPWRCSLFSLMLLCSVKRMCYILSRISKHFRKGALTPPHPSSGYLIWNQKLLIYFSTMWKFLPNRLNEKGISLYLHFNPAECLIYNLVTVFPSSKF